MPEKNLFDRANFGQEEAKDESYSEILTVTCTSY